MSATSTRLKLNGVTLGPRLKAQLLKPLVSRDYPLHYVHAESKILVKIRHFRAACDILAMLTNLATGAVPSRLAAGETVLLFTPTHLQHVYMAQTRGRGCHGTRSHHYCAWEHHEGPYLPAHVGF